MEETRLVRRRKRWIERLTIVRVLQAIIVSAIVLVILAGFLEWLVEPETFTSLGLAFWWAIGTVSTVGYGDVVPETKAGRVIASILMLGALSLIPTLTSLAVSALFTKRSAEEVEREERERDEMRQALRRIEERLARLDGEENG